MSDTDNKSTPPSKQEIMREIGAALAERRKVRGMTIEKVAQVLKIRIPYLKAMEKGEWSDLPGEVYARGFMKRYAHFLGMDGDKLMAPYLAERPASTEDQGGEPGGTSGGADVSRGLLVAIGVVAVFVIVLVKLVNKDRPAQPAATSEAPAQPAVPVVAVPTPAPQSEPAAASAEPHRIEIHSPYPLWLRVSADDRNFEGFIPQGSTWNWSAKGSFTVRLGHSRQVSMTFDGKPIELRENQKRVDLPE